MLQSRLVKGGLYRGLYDTGTKGDIGSVDDSSFGNGVGL